MSAALVAADWPTLAQVPLLAAAFVVLGIIYVGVGVRYGDVTLDDLDNRFIVMSVLIWPLLVVAGLAVLAAACVAWLVRWIGGES